MVSPLEIVRKLSTPLRWMGWAAAIGSLVLHALVVFCFTDRRDALAAAAVFPIWLWALCGAMLAAAAVPLMRSRWPVAIVLLWIVTVIIGADERKTVVRGLFKPSQIHQGEPAGSESTLRVISLNCGGNESNAEALREVADLKPDIVLVQEAPSATDLSAFAKELFGEEGAYTGGWHCAIVARGKLARRPGVFYNHGQGALLTLADGTEIELLSIHLEHATTRWDLWRRSCWKEHRDVHRERRSQLDKLLARFGDDAEGRPKIFGGDFNAPPSSNLFDTIPDEYTNAFGAAGRGMGNTFINRFPVLRIDHIYTGGGIEALDARTFRTRHSDHRMVVCDLTLPEG